MLPNASNLTDKEYFDHPAISHSKLKVFEKSIPLYACRFVQKIIPDPEPSDAMLLGTAFGDLLFQRGQVVRMPKVNKRTKAGKEELAKFEADLQDGMVAIPDTIYEQAQQMAAAARAHPVAHDLIEAQGEIEVAIIWDCLRTGLTRKAKIDKVIGNTIVEVKTTNDISDHAWSRTIAAFGYHRQVAFYEDALWEQCGVSVDNVLFLVVETSPPYEVAVRRLPLSAMELGNRQNYRLLMELKDRMERDDWSTRHKEIECIDLPKWLYD